MIGWRYKHICHDVMIINMWQRIIYQKLCIDYILWQSVMYILRNLNNNLMWTSVTMLSKWKLLTLADSPSFNESDSFCMNQSWQFCSNQGVFTMFVAQLIVTHPRWHLNNERITSSINCLPNLFSSVSEHIVGIMRLKHNMNKNGQISSHDVK